MSVVVQTLNGCRSEEMPKAGLHANGSYPSQTSGRFCGTLGQEGVITYIYGEVKDGKHNRRVAFCPTTSDSKKLKAVVTIRGGDQNQKVIGRISMENIFIIRDPLKGPESLPGIVISLEERRKLWNCQKATVNSSLIEGNEFETPISLTIDLT